MSDLMDALDDLLEAHTEIGSPLAACIQRPGPNDSAIRSRLASIGLSPSVEVVEWFGWGEPDRAAWANTGAIGDVELFWAGYPMSLAEAVRTHGGLERDLGSDGGPESDPDWRSTWLPVIWGSPAIYVADCSDPNRGSSPIRRVENQPTDGPAAPEIFPSVLALVRAAARQVRTRLEWDGESLQPRGELPRIEST